MKRVSNQALMLFTVISLLFTINIALLGGLHFADTMDANGHMSDCPLKDIVTLCPMTPLEHIGAWKAAFATILTSDVGLLLLLALCALAISTMMQHCWRLALLCEDAKRRASVCISNQPNVISPIQIALARGILNPKLF